MPGPESSPYVPGCCFISRSQAIVQRYFGMRSVELAKSTRSTQCCTTRTGSKKYSYPTFIDSTMCIMIIYLGIRLLAQYFVLVCFTKLEIL